MSIYLINCRQPRIFKVKFNRMKVTGFLVLLLMVFSRLGHAQSIDTTRQVHLQAAREIMSRAGNCALITLDKKGTPQVRTMDPFEPERDFAVWLATNPNSRKVQHIKRNPRVTLYYSNKDQNGYVTLHGKAILVDDQKEKDKRWKEEWKAFYPNRSDQYILIKVIPDYLEVIHYKRGISGDPKTWQPVRVDFK
jgi:general stress protein 26